MPDFSDWEEALGIPTGSTDMSSKKNIRLVETTIVQKTNELVKSSNELMTIDENTAVTTIMDDGALELEERVNRGKEYLRIKAVKMYESVEETLEMLRSELMPGAPASMWLAYSSLVKALNECHGKLSDVYNKLGHDANMQLLTKPEEGDAEDGKISATVDEIMDFLEQASAGDQPLDPSKAIIIAKNGAKDIDYDD